MENARTLLSYGSGTGLPLEFQRERTTALPIDALVERLKEAIEASDVWVLHVIDPQALLQRDGHSIGRARQILYFHPRYMVRLLAADSRALIEAPLKFALLETDSSVTVRWLDPAATLRRYGDPVLRRLGTELAELTELVVATALRS